MDRWIRYGWMGEKDMEEDQCSVSSRFSSSYVLDK